MIGTAALEQDMSTMAGTTSRPPFFLFLIIGLLTYPDQAKAQGVCDIPPSYIGTWYSFEMALDREFTISSTHWGEYTCLDMYVQPAENDAIEGRNSTLLLRKEDGSNTCYVCMTVLWRTPNVLQYHPSDCSSQRNSFDYMCGGGRRIPQDYDVYYTAFRTNGQPTTDCSNTFDGVYGFTLETPYGFCDSPRNRLSACEDIGSAYINNDVLMVEFGSCPNAQAPFEEFSRYQCMGTWYRTEGFVVYKFAVIADTVERDNKARYKCLITVENQNRPDNTDRWGMSHFAECRTLRSLYDVPYRLLFHRNLPHESLVTPKCNLPSYLSGSWISNGIDFIIEYSVNDTHIHSFPKCTPGTTQENVQAEDFYLSCKETSGTRFMMSKYFLGKCDAELVCYEISLQPHGEVLFTIGKSYSYTSFDDYRGAPDGSMDRRFNNVCSDQALERNTTYRFKIEYLRRLY